MRLRVKKSKDDENNLNLEFDGEISIYTVNKLKSFISQELVHAESMELNLSGITQIDSAGFQLLLFMKRDSIRKEKRIVYKDMSSPVESISQLYNEKL